MVYILFSWIIMVNEYNIQHTSKRGKAPQKPVPLTVKGCSYLLWCEVIYFMSELCMISTSKYKHVTRFRVEWPRKLKKMYACQNLEIPKAHWNWMGLGCVEAYIININRAITGSNSYLKFGYLPFQHWNQVVGLFFIWCYHSKMPSLPRTSRVCSVESLLSCS